MASNNDAHNSSTSPDTVGFTGYPAPVKSVQTHYNNIHQRQLNEATVPVMAKAKPPAVIPVFDAITGKRQN